MKKIFPVFSLALLSLTAMAQKASFKGSYPATYKGTVTDTFFGIVVPDPYRWLEIGDGEETRKWITDENKVTNDYLSQIPFRKRIADRLTQLWNYERYSAPFKEGDYLYYYRNNGLQNQSVLYRRAIKGGQEEVFLDPNTFSKDGTVSLADVSFSKDGSVAAYQTSDGGSDWTNLIVLDTKTKAQIDHLSDLKFSGVAWKGNKDFYYSTYDRPTGNQLTSKTEHHRLMSHHIGDSQSKDILVFGGELIPRRYIGGYLTEDENYLIVSAANATYGNELYIQDLKKGGAINAVVTGFDYEQEVVYEEAGKFFILTNQNAPNKKLVVVTGDDLTPQSWEDFIPEEKFPLTVSSAGHKLFAQYVQDAVSKVVQYCPCGKKEGEIILPGLGTVSGFSGKQDDTDAYYVFTNYVNPPTIYHYSWDKSQSTVWKQPAVKFNPADYESKQVFYYSKDGTKIPMIITYKKGTKLDGKNPTMLYGYGGFSISLTPAFSVSNLAFMEMGGVYAVANIRGGGEYGDQWHDAGTKFEKQNVFNDFMAAADYLVKEGYTTRNLLAISGGSNGGLLVGACITQRPDLCRVAFPQVGVLDMLRYHRFTAGAGWAYDYGTADDSKTMFTYLYHYSPVHNVHKGTCYPATMIMTGDHDDRVVPAHSFKFAAALQDAQTCGNPVLIRIETRAGHGAGKPTAMLIDEQADKWAFMFWNIGLDPYR